MSSEPEPPRLTQNDLVDLGGWIVLKEAKQLFNSNAVKETVWEPPYLIGKIEIAGTSIYPRLNLRSLTFAENKCSCIKGRQGMICSHAIALCLDIMEQKKINEAIAKQTLIREKEALQPVVEPVINSFNIDNENGTTLELIIYLPPNLLAVAPRDTIIIKTEAKINNKSNSWEKLNRGSKYKLSESQNRAILLLEKLTSGKLSSMMQLNRSQLLALLVSLEGLPNVYWANNPKNAIDWQNELKPKIYPILQNNNTESDESPKNRLEKIKVSVISNTERKKTVLSANEKGILIDGSTNFLCITLPSRENPLFHEAAEFLKRNNFIYELSNKKWWLRDRHKTLTFLAQHRKFIDNDLSAEYTNNFKERTKNLMTASLNVDTQSMGNDFAVTINLDLGETSEKDASIFFNQGKLYLESNESIYLVEPDTLKKLSDAQKALSGKFSQSAIPKFKQRFSTKELANVDTILDELVGTYESPETWKERSGALKSIAQLKQAPIAKVLDDRLRNYQRIGSAWLWHLYNNDLGGVLADEMGLGKTVQAIGLLSCISNTDNSEKNKENSLVICPASLTENWKRETNYFAEWLNVYIHHGKSRLLDEVSFAQYDVIITSYSTLTNDIDLFQKINFSCIIADEAQHMKNRRTQGARALKSLQAKCKFALTGTPIENSLDDLRSLFDFVMPGYFIKSPTHMNTDERSWLAERHQKQATPYILRRSKQLVAPELPDKIEQVIYCEMTDEQSSVYKSVKEKTDQTISQLEYSGVTGNRVLMAALTQLLRLRQTCVDPRLINDKLKSEHSAKLSAFKEILNEAIDGNHRILLFSQFVTVLKFLSNYLDENKMKYCYLDGQTKNRLAVCDKFNNDESIPIFLISLKAGGTGLNLTGADTVIHFDPWWNPAIEAQATDRAHRIGQTKTVTSIKLIAANTVEEKIMELQKSKSAILKSLLDESSAATAKVGLEDIKNILEV